MSRAAKSVAVGSLVAILASFPLVALFTLVYRFPVPFVGYESGLDAVPLALKGSIFYGVLGGYYVLLLMGAVGGLIAGRRGASDAHAMRLSASFAAISTTAAVFILSILDNIIGEW